MRWRGEWPVSWVLLTLTWTKEEVVQILVEAKSADLPTPSPVEKPRKEAYIVHNTNLFTTKIYGFHSMRTIQLADSCIGPHFITV